MAAGTISARTQGATETAGHLGEAVMPAGEGDAESTAGQGTGQEEDTATEEMVTGEEEVTGHRTGLTEVTGEVAEDRVTLKEEEGGVDDFSDQTGAVGEGAAIEAGTRRELLCRLSLEKPLRKQGAWSCVTRGVSCQLGSFRLQSLWFASSRTASR